MTRSYIPEDKKERIRQRADNRCEYCHSHQDYASNAFEIEHITPVAKGGSDEESNLCLSCKSCNGRKGAKDSAIDPETSISSRLFNPRSDIWSEHFRWNKETLEIDGISAIGRVTVIALGLNYRFMIVARKNWQDGGWKPPQ